MRAATVAGWLLGLGLIAGMLGYWGAAEVGAALALAGIGVIAVLPLHLGVLVADTLGWRAFLPASQRAGLHVLLPMRWIGVAVNGLLPVAQVGGELVRTRLLHRFGVPGATAGASVVVDLTVGLAMQLVFVGLGLTLLLVVAGGRAGLAEVSLGVVVLGVVVGVFLLAQREGLFLRLARLLERVSGGRAWLRLSGGAAALDGEIRASYRRGRNLLAGAAFRMLGWLWGSAEIWLAFYLLGHPIGIAEAVILESMAQAVRSAAFAIPGALGVQEGGLVLGAIWLGIPPELALATALIKRARELVYNLPGLLAWSLFEVRAPAPPGAPPLTGG